MKRDPKAIDAIASLEEAKDIIKMMTGNVYFGSEVYRTMDDNIKKFYEELSDEERELFNRRYTTDSKSE